MRKKRRSLTEGSPFNQTDLTKQIMRFLSTMEHFKTSRVNKHFRLVCSDSGSYTNGFKLIAKGEKLPEQYARLGFIQEDFDFSVLENQESPYERFDLHHVPNQDFIISLVRVVTVQSPHSFLSFQIPNCQSLNFFNGDIAKTLPLGKTVRSITVQGNALKSFENHFFPNLKTLILRKPYSAWDFIRMPNKLHMLSKLDPTNFPALIGVYVTESENWEVLNLFPQITHLGVRDQQIPKVPLTNIKVLHIYSEERLTQKFLSFFPNIETLACHNEVLPKSFKKNHISLNDVGPNKLPNFPSGRMFGIPRVWKEHWEKFENHFKYNI